STSATCCDCSGPGPPRRRSPASSRGTSTNAPRRKRVGAARSARSPSNHCPAGAALGLAGDALSPGLRPLVALAGTLASFAGDLLARFAAVRLSADSAWRATEAAGEALRRLDAGGAVAPHPAQPAWDFPLPGGGGLAACLGLDAFAAPMQRPDATRADWRMLYLGGLSTPAKKGAEYRADSELDRLARRVPAPAGPRGG